MVGVLAENADNWDEGLTMMRIQEYDKKKVFFDDDVHKASGLYRDIKNEFHAQGHTHLTSDHCAERMAWLAVEFNRRYDMTFNCTGIGSEVTNWVYYDAMGQLKQKNASTMPKKLMAFGTSYTTRVRQSTPEEEIVDDPLHLHLKEQEENRCC